MTVPYTQRGLIKITQGDEDEDANSEHWRRMLLLPGVTIEYNTWSFMLFKNQTTQLHFEIYVIYSSWNFQMKLWRNMNTKHKILGKNKSSYKFEHIIWVMVWADILILTPHVEVL